MGDHRAGAQVTRYEVLHGQVWMHHPVTVVSDEDDVLAVRLDPGSPFTFPEHPFGPHPWIHHVAWGGPTVLMLHRPDDRYSVWRFFDPDGTFTHWYVNFERPYGRRPDGFETDDHGLDLVVRPDGHRAWKDVEDLHHQRAEGRIDVDDVLAALAAAADVTALLDEGTHWWQAWSDWTP